MDSGEDTSGCTVATGCYVVPSGWNLVAFAGDQSSPCPVPSTQIDVDEGPDASTACLCNCTLTKAPTCPLAPIDDTFDGDGSLSCGTTGAPAQNGNASPTCNTDMYTGNIPGLGYTHLDLEYTPTATPTNGTCTKNTVSQPGNITYSSQDRVCKPTSEPCSGVECTPSFGSYSVCIAASGNQTCPGTTFTQQHVVGGPPTFTCDTSACSCTVTANDCTGTMSLFTDANCKNGKLDVPADGKCHASKAPVDNYYSYKYTPGPLGSSCDPAGTSSALNVTLTNEQTICCAP